MLKVEISHAEVHVEMDWYFRGSVLANTIEAGASACRTHLKVDSLAAQADIIRLIRLAKRGCFAEQVVRNPIPLTSTMTVNGRSADVRLD